MNPSRYRILAIGKIRKKWISEGLELYLKRLPGLTITELKDSSPQKEADAIQTQLKNNETLIILMEEGRPLASIPFAEYLKALGSKRLVFVIGGANGIAPEIKKMADLCLSLSPMTFPHEIARLLLVEQIYRATTIIHGGPYHRS
ncbi:23S rRNA (pseudouridine(1915)-N(3))-methyltransferase RlmH [Prochlorococcus sp. MIT 1307]|uniref:23S rRNA (pseudouridine(1915)-N(3))-methyltransferase RlmH n=1 Tax=Prochlorococcus sp. MIT 1307 TaxID=3096219 RepID=UPI002A7629DF|nr:23S rRNA (pseudouridine(1915)-N(3))-methyltransferase RlmH [Prochlorococcus sp. MIT 1307]